jgi:aconitate decarboxylase
VVSTIEAGHIPSTILTRTRHITGTTGSFGAAAAIAKAMKLDQDQFAAALGHAASMASGIRAMFGTDTKTLHMGRGAQNGLLAAQLAHHGFVSCPRAIESWGKLVSTTLTEESISSLAKGGGFQILENTFKPYPCGIVIHPLIDAARDAHDFFSGKTNEGRSGCAVDPDEVTSIEATVNPQCVRLCSVRHPKTGLETIFSLYHGIATGLLYGRAGQAEFSDDGCVEPQTTQIREKVQVQTSPELADDAAILKIKLRDGREHVFKVEHATGSLAKPMTLEQLEQKFVDLSRDRLGLERTREVVNKCWSLEEVVDMCDFVRLLAPQ